MKNMATDPRSIEASKSLVNDDARSFEDQRQSPFFRLPPELRNVIYEYVLGRRELRLMTRSERVEHSYSIRSRRWFSTSGVSRFEDPKLELRRFNPTMFLLVCRQVNAEAALIPFQINEFTYGNSDSFHRFVDKLSMAFEALNEFRLTGKHPAYDVVHPLTKLTGLRYVRGEQDGFVENEEDRDLAAVRGEEMAMRGLKQFGAPDGVKFQFKDRGRYICLTVPDA